MSKNTAIEAKARILSPERNDPYNKNQSSMLSKRSYKDIRAEQLLENERKNVSKKMLKNDEMKNKGFHDHAAENHATDDIIKRSRSMWDMTPNADLTPRKFGETPTPGRFNEATPFGGATPGNRFKSGWDAKTPLGMTPNDATPSTVRIKS